MSRLLLALALLAACSSEREEESILNFYVLGSACPAAGDAIPQLEDDWGGGGTHIDNMACSFEEYLRVDEPMPAPDEPACCYPSRCTEELAPAEDALLFDATCLGATCDTLDLESFSRDRAEEQLAAAALPCSLDAASAPADVTTLRCWYRVNALYSCSPEGC